MEENGFFQVKFNYAGYFKTVKTACGLRYCDGMKHSLMIDLDGYNLIEFCRDVRSLRDWGVTENIGVWYIARNVKPKKFIQVLSEQELMAIFTMYNDMKEAEIFITIQSQGIPLNYNGANTSTQEDNIGEGEGVGVDEGEGVGEWEGVGEEPGDGVGEEPAYGVGEEPAECEGEGEDVGEEPAEAVGDGVGEEPAEIVGEDIGVNIGEEAVGESDAVLSENSFRGLKSDESELEDNMDHVESFSYDVNNPIMEIGAKYPNVAAFRDALTHFALLNEFKYNL